MLFKIALKNMGKSIRDYAVYFFTIVIGVAIFYIFNSLESQTVMMNVSKDTREIIKMMITIMSGLSVFVSFVLAFLIIYANRFLMKRRNREFGIYLTLGMGKQKGVYNPGFGNLGGWYRLSGSRSGDRCRCITVYECVCCKYV